MELNNFQKVVYSEFVQHRKIIVNTSRNVGKSYLCEYIADNFPEPIILHHNRTSVIQNREQFPNSKADRISEFDVFYPYKKTIIADELALSDHYFQEKFLDYIQNFSIVETNVLIISSPEKDSPFNKYFKESLKGNTVCRPYNLGWGFSNTTIREVKHKSIIMSKKAFEKDFLI